MLKLSKTLSGDVVKRREGVCGAGVKFPSLSKLARTPETALKGIRRLVSKVVTDMIQNKESIFYPNVTKHFSGKFMVRVPPEVHREPAM
jgi:predicted HicB family RNase H-like nuclease